jgi:uncharacterized protein YoxC
VCEGDSLTASCIAMAMAAADMQQQVVSETRETRLADKAIQIRDQCNTKLAEFQNAYNNVRPQGLALHSVHARRRRSSGTYCLFHEPLPQVTRKYQAVTQENTNMKVETRELHDKYAAKSK